MTIYFANKHFFAGMLVATVACGMGYHLANQSAAVSPRPNLEGVLLMSELGELNPSQALARRNLQRRTSPFNFAFEDVGSKVHEAAVHLAAE